LSSKQEIPAAQFALFDYVPLFGEGRGGEGKEEATVYHFREEQGRIKVANDERKASRGPTGPRSRCPLPPKTCTASFVAYLFAHLPPATEENSQNTTPKPKKN